MRLTGVGRLWRRAPAVPAAAPAARPLGARLGGGGSSVVVAVCTGGSDGGSTRRGHCPHCDEPVAISDLAAPTTPQAVIMNS